LRRTLFLATAKRSTLLLMTGLLLLSATRCDAQIFHKKKKVNKSTSAENTAEPDKILYDKAMEDVKHGRHEVGRLNLQTLINTYPDSDTSPMPSWQSPIPFTKRRNGKSDAGHPGLQGFRHILSHATKAAYAQLQVAMTHYKQMEKPDRDRTHARAAEDEFQTFLSNTLTIRWRRRRNSICAKCRNCWRKVTSALVTTTS